MIEQLKTIWSQLNDDDRLTLVLTLFQDLQPGRQEAIINLLTME